MKEVNLEMSKKTIQEMKMARGACFYNASKVAAFKKVKNSKYIIGYIRDKKTKVAFIHGWVETEKFIVEPTLNLKDLDHEYYSVLEFSANEILQELEHNKKNPAFHTIKKYKQKMVDYFEEHLKHNSILFLASEEEISVEILESDIVFYQPPQPAEAE